MTKPKAATSRAGVKALAVAALLGLAACGQSENATEAPSTAPANWRVYISNEMSNDLTVIDGATNAVVATVPVGQRPRGVRASKDGKTLYIALSGSPIGGPNVDEDDLPPADKSKDGIGVFDVATGKVTRVITGVSDPEQLDIAPDGKLFIASEDRGVAVVIDPSTDKVLAEIPVGDEAEGVNISPDGKWAFVTSEEESTVTIIDVAALKAVKSLKVGERPRNTAFSADSRRAYVGGEFDGAITVIDVVNQSVLNTVRLADKSMLPMDMALLDDGKKLFVTGGRGAKVAVLDATSLSPITTIPVGQRPWGMAVSPNGKRIYTANGPSNDVSIIDVDTMKVVTTVQAGQRPWGGVAVPAP